MSPADFVTDRRAPCTQRLVLRFPRAFLIAGAGALLSLTAATAHAEPQPSGSAAVAPPPPVLVPPKLLSDANVAYPEGGQGDATVVLTLSIDTRGIVVDAQPTAEQAPFSWRAAEAARGWLFEPATRDGKPINARIRFEVSFHAPVVEAPPPGAPVTSAAPPPPPPPKEVIVQGERGEPSRTVTLTRAEVRQIPGTFGDPFRAIEIMPGVTPIVSGLPFFFIRGAPPGDVGYFLDGIKVPLLFHVGIGPSVIHPAMIQSVDLYPGGYPARFGRFSGGIVAGETAPPVPELHGEYNVRIFDVGAFAETASADNRATVSLAGRYSYTGAVLSLISSTTELKYWDYQGRASYALTPDDKVSVFAFGSYDFLGQKTATGDTLTLFGTEFHRVDVRYDHRLGDKANIRLAVTGGLDLTELPDDRFTRDRLAGIRSELVYPFSPDVTLRLGTDVQVDSYDVLINKGDLGGSTAAAAALFPTRTDIAMGLRGDAVVAVTPELTVTPGVRVDFYGSEGAAAPAIDPRLATRLQIDQRTAFLTALGIAHQPPAFVVPLPGFTPGGLKGGLQEAIQESMGLERELAASTIATVSVFHNGFLNMSDPLSSTPATLGGCVPGTFPIDTLAGDRGSGTDGRVGNCGTPRFPAGTLGPDRTGGGGQGASGGGASRAATALETRTNGYAYGLELFLKRRLTSRLGGFVSYTLSRSVRSVGRDTFVAPFDRTHVFNAAVAYDLGRNWRAGTRLVFYTGLPKAPDPTNPGATRLDPFFRVDLRLEKRWQLGKKTWISFVAEWLNATLSKEEISTTCTLQGCQAQKIGPVTIPSLGVEGGF